MFLFLLFWSYEHSFLSSIMHIDLAFPHTIWFWKWLPSLVVLHITLSIMHFHTAAMPAIKRSQTLFGGALIYFMVLCLYYCHLSVVDSHLYFLESLFCFFFVSHRVLFQYNLALFRWKYHIKNGYLDTSDVCHTIKHVWNNI